MTGLDILRAAQYDTLLHDGTRTINCDTSTTVPDRDVNLIAGLGLITLGRRYTATGCAFWALTPVGLDVLVTADRDADHPEVAA